MPCFLSAATGLLQDSYCRYEFLWTYHDFQPSTPFAIPSYPCSNWSSRTAMTQYRTSMSRRASLHSTPLLLQLSYLPSSPSSCLYVLDSLLRASNFTARLRGIVRSTFCSKCLVSQFSAVHHPYTCCAFPLTLHLSPQSTSVCLMDCRFASSFNQTVNCLRW